MIDLKAIDSSIEFYEATKRYFSRQNLSGCVIEISDAPQSEWTIHFTHTEDLMKAKRRELFLLKKPFIAIYDEVEGRYFFFKDKMISKLELLNTHEVIFYYVNDFKEYDIKLVKQEFLALKKMFQNS